MIRTATFNLAASVAVTAVVSGGVYVFRARDGEGNRHSSAHDADSLSG